MKSIKEIVTSEGFKQGAIGAVVSIGLTILADVALGALSKKSNQDDFDEYEEVSESEE